MQYYIKKYLRDIFTSSILIISLSITIFCSFNVSKYINASEEAGGELSRIYRYTMRFSIMAKENLTVEEKENLVQWETLNFKDIIDLYRSDKSNVIMVTGGLAIDNSISFHSVEMVLYGNEEIPYELESGSFNYSNDELVIYIGKEMKKFSYDIDNKEYILLCGYKFRIAGILESTSIIDYSDKILVFYDNLSAILDENSIENMIKNTGSVYICSNKSVEDVNYTRDLINSKLNKTDCYMDLITTGDGQYIYISKLFGSNLSKITDILCIINVFIILNIWIKQKHKEFAIRKAFGFSDIRILMNLLLQFIKCFSISIVLGILIQYIYNIILNTRFRIADFLGNGGRVYLYIAVVLFIAVIYHIKYISTIETKNGLSTK